MATAFPDNMDSDTCEDSPPSYEYSQQQYVESQPEKMADFLKEKGQYDIGVICSENDEDVAIAYRNMLSRLLLPYPIPDLKITVFPIKNYPVINHISIFCDRCSLVFVYVTNTFCNNEKCLQTKVSFCVNRSVLRLVLC